MTTINDKIGLAVLAVILLTGFPDRLSAQSQSSLAPGRNSDATSADPDALLRLGDLYSEGRAVPVDLAKAYLYYRRAAEAGSLRGQLHAGKMLARGLGTAQDAKLGRMLVKQVAEVDGADGFLLLGDLLSRGDAGPMDPKGAIKAYRAAAEAGNPWAWVRLGDLYLYGRFAPENAKLALDYYQRAAAQNNAYGFYGIGKIYAERKIAKAGSIRQGREFLQKAADAGVTSAVSALSDSYVDQRDSRKGGRIAVQKLTEAARGGDVAASMALVSIYRDGRRYRNEVILARNIPLARQYLEKVQARLNPADVARESFLLDAATAKRKNFAAVFDRLQDLPPASRQEAVRELLAINQPFYVYTVQAKLAELGLLRGKPTGVVNATTRKSVSVYCRPRGTKYLCSQGLLSWQLAELMSYSF